MCVSVTGGLCL